MAEASSLNEVKWEASDAKYSSLLKNNTRATLHLANSKNMYNKKKKKKKEKTEKKIFVQCNFK